MTRIGAMLFSKKNSPSLQNFEIQSAYAVGRHEIPAATLVQMAHLANSLRARRYNIVLNDGTNYPVSYVGDVLLFALRVLHEYNEFSQIVSELGRRWIAEELPILQTTPIEISPARLLECLQQAVLYDPLKQIRVPKEALQTLKLIIPERSLSLYSA